MRLPRPLALAATVLAAAVVLGLAVDGAAYAATGSSLVLGRLNTAGTTTTLESTGTGPALRLAVASSAAAPFSTNARGKVVGLDADRLDGLDASSLVARARTDVDAARLGGRTAEQLVASIPVPRFAFARTATPQTANPGFFPGVLSAAGAWPGTYRLSGWVLVPCSAASESGWLVSVLRVQSALDAVPLVRDVHVAADACGASIPVSTRTSMTTTSRLLVTVHDIDAGGLSTQPISFSLTGAPAAASL